METSQADRDVTVRVVVVPAPGGGDNTPPEASVSAGKPAPVPDTDDVDVGFCDEIITEQLQAYASAEASFCRRDAAAAQGLIRKCKSWLVNAGVRDPRKQQRFLEAVLPNALTIGPVEAAVVRASELSGWWESHVKANELAGGVLPASISTLEYVAAGATGIAGTLAVAQVARLSTGSSYWGVSMLVGAGIAGAYIGSLWTTKRSSILGATR